MLLKPITEVGLFEGRNEAGINDNARKEQLLFMEPIMFLKISHCQ
jgi:hypothetical protein